MISVSNVYRVISAVVPLYVAIGLGYASVKWWQVFNDAECAAINRFVALFAVPFLCF